MCTVTEVTTIGCIRIVGVCQFSKHRIYREWEFRKLAEKKPKPFPLFFHLHFHTCIHVPHPHVTPPQLQ